MGKVFLNEYYFGSTTNFLEIFSQDKSFSESSWTNWTIDVYSATNTAITYGSNNSPKTCTLGSKTWGTLTASSGLAAGKALVILRDENGAPVDAMVFDNTSPPAPWQDATTNYFSGLNSQCSTLADQLTSQAAASGTNPYAANMIVLSNYGNKDIARFPDGSGKWSESGLTGSNTTKTPCSSNSPVLSKTADSASVAPGGLITWTVSVTNTGNNSLSNQSIADVISSSSGAPALTNITTTPSCGTASGFGSTGGTWTISSLGKGASCTLQIQATVPSSASADQTYTNTVSTSFSGYAQSDSATVTVTAPSASSFNAWTNSTSKTIATQIAGTGFNLTVGAFDSSGTATSYTGNIGVTLEYCTNVSRTTAGAISCGGTWAAISGISATASFSAATTVTPAIPAIGNAYEIVRVKLTTASSATYYASDYFAVRPASLTLAASDETSGTAGTDRALDNSGNVHKAGQPFTIKLSTGNSNYPGTLLSVSNLTPVATLTAPTNGVAGTLAPDSWSAISGGMQTDTATYTEVGPFGVTYEDRHFADIDAADSTTAQRHFSGTATIGRFIPDHFDTAVILAGGVPMDCPTGLTCPTTYNGLVYARQSFSATITARNAAGATTSNYNTTAGYSKATTLAAYSELGGNNAPSGSGAGTLSGKAAAASDFSSGVATLAAVAYTFTTQPGTPTDIYLRATEDSGGDGVTSLRNPTTASVEGGVKVAQGRIRISNAFGNGKSPLDVPVAAQFWNGQVWAPNNKDGSTLANTAVVSSPALTLSSLTFAAGKGTLRFAAGTAGSYDIALNLGASGASLQSCVSGLTGGTAASLAWLRSRNGDCQSTYDRDPSARVTFGIYSPESRRTIHIRELF